MACQRRIIAWWFILRVRFYISSMNGDSNRFALRPLYLELQINTPVTLDMAVDEQLAWYVHRKKLRHKV